MRMHRVLRVRPLHPLMRRAARCKALVRARRAWRWVDGTSEANGRPVPGWWTLRGKGPVGTWLHVPRRRLIPGRALSALRMSWRQRSRWMTRRRPVGEPLHRMAQRWPTMRRPRRRPALRESGLRARLWPPRLH